MPAGHGRAGDPGRDPPEREARREGGAPGSARAVPQGESQLTFDELEVALLKIDEIYF